MFPGVRDRLRPRAQDLARAVGARRGLAGPHDRTRPARRDVSPRQLMLCARDRAGGRFEAYGDAVGGKRRHARDRRRARLVAVLGESGGGRTTLRQDDQPASSSPSRGEVRVAGKDVRDEDAVALRRTIGYVIQSGGLLPHLTLGDNVAIVPRLVGWTDDAIRARVAELLELVGLAAYGARFPDELSGGQRQRVGVARALAARPRLLLLDEPFGALDPITRLTLQRELARIHRELRLTSVMVTHDMVEAFTLADRIAVMWKRRAPPGRHAARARDRAGRRGCRGAGGDVVRRRRPGPFASRVLGDGGGADGGGEGPGVDRDGGRRGERGGRGWRSRARRGRMGWGEGRGREDAGSRRCADWGDPCVVDSPDSEGRSTVGEGRGGGRRGERDHMTAWRLGCPCTGGEVRRRKPRGGNARHGRAVTSTRAAAATASPAVDGGRDVRPAPRSPAAARRAPRARAGRARARAGDQLAARGLPCPRRPRLAGAAPSRWRAIVRPCRASRCSR